jgi:molybdopterin-containing oxidoreductase family membrane subunit
MTSDVAVFDEPRYANLVETMKPTTRFGLIAAALTIGVLIGVIGEIVQLLEGLGVTDLDYRKFWGLYLVNFVFFIGISHAGTLISAILRVSGAGWRAPITRMAESITVFSLIIGGSMILIDMGQVFRVFNIVNGPNWTSPILWDFVSVSTYLFGSMLFLYLPMIPDNGLLRDYFKRELDNADVTSSTTMLKIRYHFHRILALNWKGTEVQVERLERGIKIMSIIIIPIAVSVHTVVSFVFSMTWRPGWHSSIFGPYFVVGAIFSGIAALLVAMAIFRKMYKLEEFIKPEQFNNLALLMLAFALMYLYFTVSEFLTATYTSWAEDAEIFQQLFYGQFAWGFWFFFIGGLVIPIVLLVIPKFRHSVFWVAVAGVLAVLGMWVKRYIIVIPTVTSPVFTEGWLTYNPTWVETGITLMGFTGLILMFMIFSKLFPIVAIYEVHEYEEELRKQKQMAVLYDKSHGTSSVSPGD